MFVNAHSVSWPIDFVISRNTPHAKDVDAWEWLKPGSWTDLRAYFNNNVLERIDQSRVLTNLGAHKDGCTRFGDNMLDKDIYMRNFFRFCTDNVSEKKSLPIRVVKTCLLVHREYLAQLLGSLGKSVNAQNNIDVPIKLTCLITRSV